MMEALYNAELSALKKRFLKFYEDYSVDNIAATDEIYTQDVEFIDPVHRVNGGLALKNYLRKMALNLQYYQIDYVDSLWGEDSAYLTWEMTYSHKSLEGGRLITLRGMSHLKYTSRIYYHEDSYDLGQMLYEHIPLLGPMTRFLKKRLSS